MAALATIPDLEARIGTLTAAQNARAAALLDDASAFVRDDTGQIFEQVSADTIVLRPVGLDLVLPRRPVTAVTSVAALGCPPDGETTLGTDEWCWDGIDKIRLDPFAGVDTGATPWHRAGTDTYRVNYDHGPAAIPDIVRAVVCEMVNRVLTSPSIADGLTQETVGQYGYQVQQSIGSQGTAVRYTANDKLKLRRYRRTAATIKTPTG